VAFLSFQLLQLELARPERLLMTLLPIPFSTSRLRRSMACCSIQLG
jgi:hypothetical protein